MPVQKERVDSWLSSQSNTGAKFFGINIIDDPETTDINEVKNEEESVKNQNVYDLSGRLVGTSPKGLKPGLYIQGGKKVILK